MHYKVWDEITYSLLNFNDAAVEVWELISNFILHFIGHMITYPCWDWSLTMLVKGAFRCCKFLNGTCYFQELAEEFGIPALPTFIFFKNCEKVGSDYTLSKYDKTVNVNFSLYT